MFSFESLSSIGAQFESVIRKLEEFDIVNRLARFVDHVKDGEYVSALTIAVETAVEIGPELVKFQSEVVDVVSEMFGSPISFEDITQAFDTVVDFLKDAIERVDELTADDWSAILQVGGHMIAAGVMFASQNYVGGAISLGRAFSVAGVHLKNHTEVDAYAEMAVEMPSSFTVPLVGDFKTKDPLDLQDEYFTEFLEEKRGK